DPHALALALAALGAGDKAFARGVDFARLGPAAVEPFGKAGAVRREVDPAMDDDFQIRKEIGEPRAAFGMAARQLVEKQQEPTWRAGDAADVCMGRRAGEPRHLLAPIGG